MKLSSIDINFFSDESEKYTRASGQSPMAMLSIRTGSRLRVQVELCTNNLEFSMLRRLALKRPSVCLPADLKHFFPQDLDVHCHHISHLAPARSCPETVSVGLYNMPRGHGGFEHANRMVLGHTAIVGNEKVRCLAAAAAKSTILPTELDNQPNAPALRSIIKRLLVQAKQDCWETKKAKFFTWYNQ